MNPVIAGHRCTLRVLVSAAIAMAALAAPPAQASRPVPRTITGCVTNGVLTSDDGYRISPMQKNHQPMPLAAYNGKRISAAGHEGERPETGEQENVPAYIFLFRVQFLWVRFFEVHLCRERGIGGATSCPRLNSYRFYRWGPQTQQ